MCEAIRRDKAAAFVDSMYLSEGMIAEEHADTLLAQARLSEAWRQINAEEETCGVVGLQVCFER
jgi:hypothetical protein